jgi:hypothetical protein
MYERANCARKKIGEVTMQLLSAATHYIIIGRDSVFCKPASHYLKKYAQLSSNGREGRIMLLSIVVVRK